MVKIIPIENGNDIMKALEEFLYGEPEQCDGVEESGETVEQDEEVEDYQGDCDSEETVEETTPDTESLTKQLKEGISDTLKSLNNISVPPGVRAHALVELHYIIKDLKNV